MTTVKRLFVSALLCLCFFTNTSSGAGVTLVTHGDNSTADDWVQAMAEKVLAYPNRLGTNITCYEIYFTSISNVYTPVWRRFGGSAPSATDSGEIVIKLDWRDPVNNLPTTDVGPVIAYFCLLQTNFISELNGHALAEFPMHFIGHSRGGSLIAEMAKYLGSWGVWVDQLTFLDAFQSGSDGPVRVYENALYADNYYQRINIFPQGVIVSGAYNRKPTNLGIEGYTGLFEGHSDIHLWYHATIDWHTPTSDYNSFAFFGTGARNSWYSDYEAKGTNAGFFYSRMGLGNRFSTVRPVTNVVDTPRDGVNKKWDFGAGVQNNRVTLSLHEGLGNWPNPITVGLMRTNPVYCHETNTVSFRYQWADYSSNSSTAHLFLDHDRNPLNGNEFFVATTNVSGTGQSAIGGNSFSFTARPLGLVPRTYYPFVVMTDQGRKRYLYTKESFRYRGGCLNPTNAIERLTASTARISVSGSIGEEVVLEQSQNLVSWQPLATNTLISNPWRVTNSIGSSRFFRSFIR